MSKTAEKTDPKLWEKVKEEVTDGDRGGRPGQWSARKAQMASQEYKKRGGGYAGGKSDDNSLQRWSDEDWGTKSGEKSNETGERYLPRKAREGISDEDYRRSTAKKREDTEKGKQFSSQPKDVARKTAAHRGGGGGDSKAELMEQARRKNISGRSTMSKDQLQRALAG